MAFKVLASLADSGDSVYYTPAFREQLETHLNIFKNTNPRRIQVEANELWQFEGNLFGYLAARGESHDIHWIIMRMNGFHNPNEFGRKVAELAAPVAGMTLLLPDGGLLESIRTLYLNKQKEA